VPPLTSTTVYTCCGPRTGSILSNRAFNALKMAVFAPIPSARVTMAVAVKPGERPNCRMAMRTPELSQPSFTSHARKNINNKTLKNTRVLNMDINSPIAALPFLLCIASR